MCGLWYAGVRVGIEAPREHRERDVERAGNHSVSATLVVRARVDQQRRPLCRVRSGRGPASGCELPARGRRAVGASRPTGSRSCSEYVVSACVAIRQARLPASCLRPAILARAAQDDVVRGDGVAAPVCDALDRRLRARGPRTARPCRSRRTRGGGDGRRRRARARSARRRRRGRPAGRARARRARRARGTRSRSRPGAPRPARASWISCAERQQSCSPRSSTTSRRAPPLRPLASRRRVERRLGPGHLPWR